MTNSETPSAALETPADPPTASPEKPAAEREAPQPETSQPDGSTMAPASEDAPAAEPQLDSDASAADTAADALSVPEATASETAAPSAPPTPKTPAQSQSESTRSQQELLAATTPASQPSPRLPPMHSRQQQTKGGLPAEGGQSEASMRLLACPYPSSARPHAVVYTSYAWQLALQLHTCQCCTRHLHIIWITKSAATCMYCPNCSAGLLSTWHEMLQAVTSCLRNTLMHLQSSALPGTGGNHVSMVCTLQS